MFPEQPLELHRHSLSNWVSKESIVFLLCVASAIYLEESKPVTKQPATSFEITIEGLPTQQVFGVGHMQRANAIAVTTHEEISTDKTALVAAYESRSQASSKQKEMRNRAKDTPALAPLERRLTG